MSLQPVLITNPTNILQGTAGHARGQSAALPNDADAQSDSATEKTKRQRSVCRAVAISRITSQHAEDCSGGCGSGCISNCSAQKRSEGASVKECFLAGTCSRQPRIQNLSPVFNLGL